MSNFSSYEELASNGYVVVSIDHPYHSFMTRHDDGEVILGDSKFISDAMMVQNGDTSIEESFKLQQEWLQLRTEDMGFVLNYIKDMVSNPNNDLVYKMIDLDHIGAFGHSLGGATSAQVGKDFEEVDAVIVVDGTMLGEIVGVENGKEIISDSTYPKPILNIYNESHYEEALKLKNNYPNIALKNNSYEAYEVVFKGSKHMNFTDLPMISPFLATQLDGGTTANIDPRYCINTTNHEILQFFDRYLKSSNIEIVKEKAY